MRRHRKALFASVLGMVLIGTAVVPSIAAPEKQFTITAAASVAPGATTLDVVVRNTTPNGNSNISSLILTAAGPTGFAITGVSPGMGTVSNGGSALAINNISPIKPGKATTFHLSVTVPDLGCDGGTITWAAEAFTGNSLGGDEFTFKTVAGVTNTQTAIASSCATITVTKYEDPDFDGVVDTGEDPLAGWEFTLEDAAGEPVGAAQVTNVSGQIVYTVAPGDYTVCETDPRADPTSATYEDEPWVNTSPGGDRCADVTVATGEAESIDFLNALGTLACEGANSTANEAGGGTSVDLTRGDNADGSVCILVPFQLTADTDIVNFIKDLTTQPYATFELVITWGVPADDYPNFGTTTFDLDGNFSTTADTFVPDNCDVIGGVAQPPNNPVLLPDDSLSFWPSLAGSPEEPWCHAGTTVEPVGDGYEVTETFLGGGDPSIVRNR